MSANSSGELPPHHETDCESAIPDEQLDRLVRVALAVAPASREVLAYLGRRGEFESRSLKTDGGMPRGRPVLHAVGWLTIWCRWPSTAFIGHLYNYVAHVCRDDHFESDLPGLIEPLLAEVDADRGAVRLWRDVLIRFPRVRQRVVEDFAALREWRPVDLIATPHADTRRAIRQVIADWDGRDWTVVRAVLRSIGRTEEEVGRMTELEVRMEFAIRQKSMIAGLGGRAETHTSKILPASEAEAATDSVSTASDTQPRDPLGTQSRLPPAREALTPTEEALWRLLTPPGQSRSADWLAHRDRLDTSDDYVRQCVASMRAKGWPVEGGRGGTGYWRGDDRREGSARDQT